MKVEDLQFLELAFRASYISIFQRIYILHSFEDEKGKRKIENKK